MTAIGLRVGPFEIIGATEVPEPGDWHLAERTGMTRRQPSHVLVRLLPADASPDDRQALHQQFEFLKALEDPRIPEAVAFYEGLGALALASVDGFDLRSLIARRRHDQVEMSPATLLDIVLEVADTLQRAHHRNRHHGDLSPDRVLLGADGRVWVFGFGRPPGARPDEEWVPPERRGGGASDAATDQWYLGVLAAGLVTGLTPYASHDEASRGEVTTLIDRVESQWPALGRLLRRMTETRPENRFPSMHPVRQELLALSRKAGGTSERREIGARLTQPRTRTLQAKAAMRDPYAPDEDDSDPDSEEEGATQLIDASLAGELMAELGLLTDEEDLPEEDGPPSVIDGFTAANELPETPVFTDEDESDAEPDLTVPDPFAEAGIRPPFEKLPDEPIPVVRPDVSEEVPVATLGRLVAGGDLPAGSGPDLSQEELAETPVGFEPRFETVQPGGGDDSEEDDQSATVVFRADDIAHLTEGYFGVIDEGGAATAVPSTDSGEADTSPDDEATDVSAEVPMASELPSAAVSSAAASGGDPDMVRKVAPVLVGLFVVALLVWFATQML